MCTGRKHSWHNELGLLDEGQWCHLDNSIKTQLLSRNPTAFRKHSSTAPPSLMRKGKGCVRTEAPLRRDWASPCQTACCEVGPFTISRGNMCWCFTILWMNNLPRISPCQFKVPAPCSTLRHATSEDRTGGHQQFECKFPFAFYSPSSSFGCPSFGSKPR